MSSSTSWTDVALNLTNVAWAAGLMYFIAPIPKSRKVTYSHRDGRRIMTDYTWQKDPLSLFPNTNTVERELDDNVRLDGDK